MGRQDYPDPSGGHRFQRARRHGRDKESTYSWWWTYYCSTDAEGCFVHSNTQRVKCRSYQCDTLPDYVGQQRHPSQEDTQPAMRRIIAVVVVVWLRSQVRMNPSTPKGERKGVFPLSIHSHRRFSPLLVVPAAVVSSPGRRFPLVMPRDTASWMSSSGHCNVDRLVSTLAVAISNPWALVASSSFIYTNDGFSLMRIDLSGSKTTLAGSSSRAGSTNGVGTAALFGWIRGITLLPDDDILVTSNNTVRHIRKEGDFYVSTYIRNLRSKDVDGFGTNASLRDPRGLQYLSTGIGDFVFVCTSWHLRIIEAPAAPPTTQAPTYESSASAGSVVDPTSAISTSVIVAICVLSVVVLSALVALVVFFLKRPTKRNGTRTTTPPPPETTPPPPPPAATAAAGFLRGGAVQGTVVLPVQPQPQLPPAYSAGEYLYPYPAEGEQDVEVVVEQQPAVSRGQQQQQSEPELCLTKDVPSVSV